MSESSLIDCAGSEWDEVGGDSLADLRQFKQREKITIVLSVEAWDAARNDPTLLEEFGREILATDSLAAYWGVDATIISSALDGCVAIVFKEAGRIFPRGIHSSSRLSSISSVPSISGSLLLIEGSPKGEDEG